MDRTSGSKISISLPSDNLQQMCNYVAIAETKSSQECLNELILRALLTFEKEKASSAAEVAIILKTIFYVEVPEYQIQEALDYLVEKGRIYKPLGTNFVLTSETRTRVTTNIDQASQLQERVKSQWLEEIKRRFPDLETEPAWAALRDYLSKSFLRHGMQVAVFLDPSVEMPLEYAASLSTLLLEAVRSKFDPIHQETAKLVISDFLANVGKYPDRSQFIAECADGAANYFALAISPDVSEQFRKKLNSLLLFCDTNFLFGILDLHVHPLVEVSNELLDSIPKHSLPLELKYHEDTLRELVASISFYGDILRRHRWSRGLSRAAAQSRYISGIEAKYHQKNAQSHIDVETFLRPYRHVDVLLSDRNISVYNPTIDRTADRASLEIEYKEYLVQREKKKPEQLRKEKPDVLITHDVSVLDCVYTLRNSATSTLEAGALFVTCDYALYGFDSEKSRKVKSQASVVLPNILLQILRPFIPTNQDFNRSFAETFAIPEFRTVGSGASKACSKMLGLLATYKDFPEETATKLLSNEILIDNLRAAENDEQFRAQVESAISTENQSLLEERAALEKHVVDLRSEKKKAEKKLEEQKLAASLESAKAQEEIKAKERETKELAASKMNLESKLKKAELWRNGEAKALRTVKIISVIAAISVCLIFLLVVNKAWQWDWLLSHRNSYGLQGCICFMIAFGIIGVFVKSWRKALWVTGLSGVIFVVLQLLGGPNNNP